MSLTPIYGWKYVDQGASWNGGAHTSLTLQSDGFFIFKPAAYSAGVIAGLGYPGESTDYFTITHGFHVSRGSYRVVESGVPVTSFASLGASDALVVLRRGSTVYYMVGVPGSSYSHPDFGHLVPGNVVHASTAPSAGAMVLDVSMYSIGDCIEYAGVSDALYLLDAYGNSTVYTDTAVAPAYGGTASAFLQPMAGVCGDHPVAGSTPYFFLDGSASVSLGDGVEVVMQPLTAQAGKAYALCSASLQPLHGTALEDTFSVPVAGAIGRLPVLIGFGVSRATVVVQATLSLSGHTSGTAHGRGMSSIPDGLARIHGNLFMLGVGGASSALQGASGGLFAFGSAYGGPLSSRYTPPHGYAEVRGVFPSAEGHSSGYTYTDTQTLLGSPPPTQLDGMTVDWEVVTRTGLSGQVTTAAYSNQNITVIVRDYSSKQHVQSVAPGPSGIWVVQVPPGSYDVTYRLAGFQDIHAGPFTVV